MNQFTCSIIHLVQLQLNFAERGRNWKMEHTSIFFFSSMKVFINNTMLPPLLIVKQISHTHLNHLNRIPATSLLLLLCTIVSLSRESGQTQASVKLKIEAKETVNFMLSAKNIIAIHCIVNFNHFQSPPATNNFYWAWKSLKKVLMQKIQKFCADGYKPKIGFIAILSSYFQHFDQSLTSERPPRK